MRSASVYSILRMDDMSKLVYYGYTVCSIRQDRYSDHNL